MKKYISLILLLALMGAVVSGILIWLDYNSGLGEVESYCGGWLASQCGEILNQSEYATLFGFPFATYGLFFYIFLLLIVLITNYIEGGYLFLSFLILFSLIILSVAIDVFLASIMISHRTFCLLCASTYLINLALLAVMILWYKKLKEIGFSWSRALEVVKLKESTFRRHKIVAALVFIFILLLAFAVFSTSYILRLKTVPFRQEKAQTEERVAEFYQQKPENLTFPESSLVIGKRDAKVKIIVFTDFLCTYCYKIFQLEQDIDSKYGDRISFIYYNYPLDQDCNPYVERSIYTSSCTAARAFVSAASLKIFQEYHVSFFSHYEEFHEYYDLDKAIEIASRVVNTARFKQEMDSDLTAQIVRRDIELGEKLHIDGTPTLFINGRRIVGVPSYRVLEMIIERELKDKVD